MVKVAVLLVKYFLFGCNIIFVILIIVIVVLGAIQMRDEVNYKLLVGHRATISRTVLISSAVLIIFYASLGSWGVIKEDYVVLFTVGLALEFRNYALFLSTTMVLNIFIAVTSLPASIEYTEQVRMKNAFERSIEKYNNTIEIQTAWDTIQQHLQCCGVNNATDWDDNIPESCCKNPPELQEKCSDESLFKNGCWEKVLNNVGNYRKERIVGSIVLIIVKGVFVVSACFVGTAIKEEKKMVAQIEKREKEEKRKEDQERKEEEAERNEMEKEKKETARDPI